MFKPSEIWLSLDLSSPQGSLALHRYQAGGGVQCLGDFTVGTQWTHSEQVFPVLQTALTNHSLALSQIDRWITTEGPGSFTGLRLALSVLKAFAFSTGRPIETVHGSEARARAYLREFPEINFGKLRVVTHATARKAVQMDWNLKNGQLADTGLEAVIDSPFNLQDSQTLVLMDGQVVALENGLGESVIYPLKAKHLAETLLANQSRQTFTSHNEVIGLSPRYFATAPLRKVEAAAKFSQ